jgi:class 3 adenylate cyclase/TolB-like protein/Tfp pilus assembly protein PilF
MLFNNNKQISSAIMFTDMVGYSRMVAKDQGHALRLLDEHNNIIIPLIKKHEGKVIKLIGDSVFSQFENATITAECAIMIQGAIQKRNSLNHTEDKFHIRVGLHKGSFVVKDDDLFGNDVNLCSRIEGIAPKDGIAVSEIFAKSIGENQNMWLREMGFVKLKNIITPQRIYKLYLNKQSYQKESYNELIRLQEEQGVTYVDIETYTETEIQPIAILYLDNLGKKTDDTLCQSITESLIDDLKRVSSIRSPSFNTVQKYRDSQLPLSEIARRLNVDKLIYGSMIKMDDNIKISLEMLDTTSGEVSWSKKWEGNTKYTGNLTGQILKSILEKLNTEIPEHIARYFTYEMTDNAEANEKYIKGKMALEFIQNHDKLEEAEKLFQDAIELDNQFVEAYAYLGMVYRWMNQYQKAERQLEVALELAKKDYNDPGLVMVYNFLGILYRSWRNYSKAIISFEKGIEKVIHLQDRLTEAKLHQNMTGCYISLNQMSEAKHGLEKTLEIYTEYEEEFGVGNVLAEMGNMYINQGKFSDGLLQYTKALGRYRKTDLRMNEYRVLFVIADTFAKIGIYEEAERYLKEAKLLSHDFVNYYYGLARMYNISSQINTWKGKMDEAIEDLKEAIENFNVCDQDFQEANHLNQLAYIYIEMNNSEKAKRILKKSMRIAEKNEETGVMLRIRILDLLIEASDGKVENKNIQNILNEVQDALENIENNADMVTNSWLETAENLWLLSQIYMMQNNQNKAEELIFKAQPVLQILANNITDPVHKTAFLDHNIYNRNITGNIQVFKRH